MVSPSPPGARSGGRVGFLSPLSPEGRGVGGEGESVAFRPSPPTPSPPRGEGREDGTSRQRQTSPPSGCRHGGAVKSTERRADRLRVAHFDCFSGISGDMTLAALI